jgi:hypothetical protein
VTASVAVVGAFFLSIFVGLGLGALLGFLRTASRLPGS